jgi:hypothetical protein
MRSRLQLWISKIFITCLTALFCILGLFENAKAESLIGFSDGSVSSESFAPLGHQKFTWAASWTQTVPASDVTIKAYVHNNEQTSNQGTAYLMDSIGAGTTSSDELVSPASFLAPVLTDAQRWDLNTATPVTLFTGLTLASGTYYLVLDGPTSAIANPYNWYGDFLSVTTSTAPGFSLNPYQYANINFGPLPDYAPASDFHVFTDPSIILFFEVSAQPIPEPTTMLLLGSGLICLAGYGRKKFFKK